MPKDTLEKAYALVEKMTTEEQIKLKEWVQQKLKEKEDAAAAELLLIRAPQKGLE